MDALLEAPASPRAATTRPSGGGSSGRVYYAPLFFAALALRLLAALTVAKGDPKLWFYSQTSELGCLAQSLLDGHGLASPFCGITGPSAFLAPGYPLLVAAAFRLFGAHGNAAALLLVGCQILFGALTVPAAMRIASRVAGARSANIAGVLCAASPGLVWLPLIFWETSLSSLLLTAAIALALECAVASNRLIWPVLGLLCGIAALVNPALLLALAAVVLWPARNCGARSRRAGPIVALLVWLAIFAGWPIRNRLVLHAFVPLRSNLGYELWQGNRTGSDGTFDPTLHPNVNRIEHERYARLGEIAYMREKSGLAMNAIAASPARFARLSLLRVARFWTGAVPGNPSRLLIATISASSLTGLAGLVLLADRKRPYFFLLAAPLMLYPLPYYLTHADFRFRLVLEPLATVLGAYVVERCLRAAAVDLKPRSAP